MYGVLFLLGHQSMVKFHRQIQKETTGYFSGAVIIRRNRIVIFDCVFNCNIQLLYLFLFDVHGHPGRDNFRCLDVNINSSNNHAYGGNR